MQDRCRRRCQSLSVLSSRLLISAVSLQSHSCRLGWPFGPPIRSIAASLAASTCCQQEGQACAACYALQAHAAGAPARAAAQPAADPGFGLGRNRPHGWDALYPVVTYTQYESMFFPKIQCQYPLLESSQCVLAGGVLALSHNFCLFLCCLWAIM